MRTGIINLAIIDDHTLVRKTLKNYLTQQPNLQVCIEAAHAVELFEALPRFPIDILIMDVFMPYTNGHEVLQLVRIKHPEIKVIGLSMSTDPTLINELLDIGILAYISKADEPETLLQAIIAVSENRLYRNKLLTEALYVNKQLTVKSSSAKKIIFDDREKKILQLLWEEKSNKEIAAEVFLSVRSIEKIRQNMKEKLAVKSTIGLLKYALHNNLIEVNKKSIVLSS